MSAGLPVYHQKRKRKGWHEDNFFTQAAKPNALHATSYNYILTNMSGICSSYLSRMHMT